MTSSPIMVAAGMLAVGMLGLALGLALGIGWASRLAHKNQEAEAAAARKLRHDLRGALSPALLCTDRLLAHADPAIRQSGDRVLNAIQRSVSLLDDTGGRGDPG